jgi:DNA replication protein DnaC
MRPPATEDLYDVIDGRYQKASTILTTNRAFSEWPELFDQPLLASAAIDRMADGAVQITITGDSYRVKGPRSRSSRASVAEESSPRRGAEARRSQSMERKMAAEKA